MIRCDRCGRQNNPGSLYCIGCGHPLGRPAPPQPMSQPPPAQPYIPPPLQAPMVAPMPAPQGPRIVVMGLDGIYQGEHPLKEGDNLIGRNVGGVLGADGTLSKLHATVTLAQGVATARDEGATNGTYFRVAPKTPTPLRDGDRIHLGRTLLRFESGASSLADTEGMGGTLPLGGALGRLHLLVGRDEDKAKSPFFLGTEGVSFGRSVADVRFANDELISASHCRITVDGGVIVVVDLGSANGTFLSFHGTRPLKHGDVLMMGARYFHVMLG